VRVVFYIGSLHGLRGVRLIEDQLEKCIATNFSLLTLIVFWALMGTGCQGLALRCRVGFLASSSGGTHALGEAVV
jgi:succinate dehydrogenase hydrophobic anchor subunit